MNELEEDAKLDPVTEATVNLNFVSSQLEHLAKSFSAIGNDKLAGNLILLAAITDDGKNKLRGEYSKLLNQSVQAAQNNIQTILGGD